MVSDERALAVRLASTEDDALARTFADRGVAAPRRPGTTSSTPPPGCWIRHPSSARSHGSPARRSSPSLAALDGASLPASELAVLRPLALVGDDGAPFGAVAARVRTASIARPDAFVTEPRRSARRRGRTTRTPPLRPSAPSRPSAHWPTCCSPACTRRCRARAPVRSARSIGVDSRMPEPSRRRTTSTTWSPPPPPPTS